MDVATSQIETTALRAPLSSWRVSKLAFVSRVLLGLILVSGGINNLEFVDRVNFYPTPEGDRVLRLLQETGYLFYAVALAEIAAGALFLSGYFVSLALVVTAPLLVNFFLFHTVVQLAGIEAVLITGAPYLYLVYIHRAHFADILSPS